MGAPLLPQHLVDPDSGSDAAFWSALVDSLPDPAWVVSAISMRVLAANAAAYKLLQPGEGGLVGRQAVNLLLTTEDDAYWTEAGFGDPGPLLSETEITVGDGSQRRVQRSIRPFAYGPSGARNYVVVLSDLTERHKVQEQLEQAVSELKATLESTEDGILVTDVNDGIRSFNQNFASLWTLPQALLEKRDDAQVHAWLRHQVEDVQSYDTRLREIVNEAGLSARDRLQLSSGKILERIATPLWRNGQAVGRVYAFRDLSQQEAADYRIIQLARTDPLTGLPNRAELATAVGHAADQDKPRFALLLVALDRFSTVNETLGVASGDLVLLEVARRLQSCLREEDMAARIGGDQFALLIHDADVPAAETVAQRVLDAVLPTMQVGEGGMPFTLTCSIGLVASPVHGTGFDDLLNKAEAALRRAKSSGRGCWRTHVLRRAGETRESLRMDHAMRQALNQDRFRLCYQPQVDIRTGEVVGAEALMRWHDNDFGGEVSPGRFIPVAEDSGLIISLGSWALDKAVRQAAQWQRSGLRVPTAVNVSALQFQQPDFIQVVADKLSQYELAPELIELEVTESILMNDLGDMLTRLQGLADLGVRLSIDDFGTGYSNLAYLKSLPVHKLKIDRSFIIGLPSDGRDAGIVTAILQLAQALGLDAIAEGVENIEQCQFLRQAGCSRFQGFLFAPALEVARFENRWRASRGGLAN